MARLSDTLLGAVGPAATEYAPMVDVRQGAQFGFQTDGAGYVSSAAYVKQNLIVLLLESPVGFQDIDPTGAMTGMLKALFEEQAQSWEGLNQEVTAEFNETPFGGAGEMQQDLINMTRARSEPALTVPDKYGKPWSKFFRLWLNGIMMDPISKFPDVVTGGTGGNAKPTDLLPDYMAATAIFIEPDPTHTFPVEAWLITNMMPQNSGPIEGRRNLTQAKEVTELNIPFTGIQMVGEGVLQLAQSLMDQLSLDGANPNTRAAFLQDVDADVSAQNAIGYAQSIQTINGGV